AVLCEGPRVRRTDGAGRLGGLGDRRHVALDADAVHDAERAAGLRAQPAPGPGQRPPRGPRAPAGPRPRPPRPRRAPLLTARGGERLFLTLGDDAEEAAVPHDGDDSRERPDPCVVDVLE